MDSEEIKENLAAIEECVISNSVRDAINLLNKRIEALEEQAYRHSCDSYAHDQLIG